MLPHVAESSSNSPGGVEGFIKSKRDMQHALPANEKLLQITQINLKS